MEKGDMIVGKVRMNPLSNDLIPCIELLLFEGLSEGDLVLLEVKNVKWIPNGKQKEKEK